VLPSNSETPEQQLEGLYAANVGQSMPKKGTKKTAGGKGAKAEPETASKKQLAERLASALERLSAWANELYWLEGSRNHKTAAQIEDLAANSPAERMSQILDTCPPGERNAVLFRVVADAYMRADLARYEIEARPLLEHLACAVAASALYENIQAGRDSAERLHRALDALDRPKDIDNIEPKRYAFYRAICDFMDPPKAQRTNESPSQALLAEVRARATPESLLLAKVCAAVALNSSTSKAFGTSEGARDVAKRVVENWKRVVRLGKLTTFKPWADINALANCWGLGWMTAAGSQGEDKKHPFASWVGDYEKRLAKKPR
jgi:hypothetical protein